MNLTRRTFLSALGISGLAVTGCGSSNAASAGTSPIPSSSSISGTVTFWHAYSSDSPEVRTLTTVVIPKFESMHPGVTIKQVPMPYDSLHQKLVTSAAGAQLPDLVRSDIIWVPELADLDVLEPLDQVLEDFDSLKSQVFPGPLATNKWKDHYYGLPLDTNTRVMLYNEDSLSKLGASKAPASLDDLRTLGAKSASTGVYAYADGGTGGWNILPLIWSNGGDITDAGITTSKGYINGPKSVQVVQMLADLFKEKAIPDLMIGSKGALQTSDGVAKGKYATTLDGPWMYPIWQAQYPKFHPGAGQVPAGPGGSISVVGGEDIVLTKDSQNKTAAAAFLRYLLSEEAQLAMAKVGQMPVLSSLGSKLADIQPYYATFAEQLKTAKPRTPTPAWSKIDTILGNQVQAAVKGSQPVQAALDAAATQIDAALGQYQ